MTVCSFYSKLKTQTEVGYETMNKAGANFEQSWQSLVFQWLICLQGIILWEAPNLFLLHLHSNFKIIWPEISDISLYEKYIF